MTPVSWLDDEPHAFAFARQAARLVSAGVRRPVAFLVGAALLVALVAAVVLVSKRSFAPSSVLRIVETDRDPGTMPAPRRQLAEYVRQGVFTSEPLLALVKRYGLYPSLARRNPRAALDSFREDIDVEVYDNYFVEDRPRGRAPRTARLSVAFHGANPEIAVAVTRSLAALIVDHEIAIRREESARVLLRATREAEAAERAVLARSAEIAARALTVDQASGRDPRAEVELVGLRGSLPALERRRDAAEHGAASLAVGAALESHGLGMRFETVEDAALSSAAEREDRRVYFASLSLVLGLPLLAMAVGAFDPKAGRS